jgi:hypothetical protein
MMRRNAFAVLSALVLCACAGTPAPDPSSVAMAPGLTMRLPPAAAVPQPVEAVQSVVATYGGGTVAFEGRIETSPGRFLMVCSDPLGRRALTVLWTEAGIEADAAPWLPKALRAENMLADLVTIYWPLDALKAALPGADIEADAAHRSVRAEGKEILRADYDPAGPDPWTETVRYRNAAWNYTLTIRSAGVP